MLVRAAVAQDAEAIASIYDHYVITSPATFDTEPGGTDARIPWLAGRPERYPVIVAELDGRVVGWGSLSEWRSRPGWRHTVEVATYVAEGHTGQGVGRALLARLVELGEQHGHHALLAQIVAENEPSLGLFERFGFERVGLLREVGRKFDRWIDLVIVERVL